MQAMEAVLAATARPTIGPTRPRRAPMRPFTFVLALVLATCEMPLSNSEARPWDALHCGRTDLAHLPAKYFLGETCSAPCDGEEHLFDLNTDHNLKRA